jgi:hypothetical protein
VARPKTSMDAHDATQSQQLTLALGRYSMTGYVIGLNPLSRTANVAFVGQNVITLGSAMALFGGGRTLGNAIAAQTGAFSPVTLNFGGLRPSTIE